MPVLASKAASLDSMSADHFASTVASPPGSSMCEAAARSWGAQRSTADRAVQVKIRCMGLRIGAWRIRGKPKPAGPDLGKAEMLPQGAKVRENGVRPRRGELLLGMGAGCHDPAGDRTVVRRVDVKRRVAHEKGGNPPSAQ